ncbi:TOBE domain-containing protein, partial [Rhizobiaceae sp. 2RAB30]
LRAEIVVEGIVNYGNSMVLMSRLNDAAFSLRLLNKAGAHIAVGDKVAIAVDPQDLWPLV